MESGVIKQRMPWGAGTIRADGDGRQIAFLAGVVNKPWPQVLKGRQVLFERYAGRDEAKKVVI